jgi:hypothetical protein
MLRDGASFMALVTRPRGGTRSISILFQSRSGSGNTRGPVANSPQKAWASHRRKAAQIPVMSDQDRAGANVDPRADVESPVSKDADGLASE